MRFVEIEKYPEGYKNETGFESVLDSFRIRKYKTTYYELEDAFPTAINVLGIVFIFSLIETLIAFVFLKYRKKDLIALFVSSLFAKSVTVLSFIIAHIKEFHDYTYKTELKDIPLFLLCPILEGTISAILIKNKKVNPFFISFVCNLIIIVPFILFSLK